MPFRYLGPPPPHRPNWNSLNSSQKRYAIEQHNIARARRNLPPFVLGEAAPNEEYVDDPDLQWNFDGGINPNDLVQQQMSTEQPTVSSDVVSSPSGTSSAKRKRVDLPGTGNEDANDADTGNPSIENASIPSAPNRTTGYTMVFRKHHTLVSYGVANIQLGLGSVDGDRIGTTNLMYVPVDKPYFYLSPSEYLNMISKVRGVKVLEVKCKIVLRNPRTAFETNSSTSNLATLNQNKFIQIAHGLINKTRGLNLKYNFDTATSPMKPSSVALMNKEIQHKFICSAYGVTDAMAINFESGATLPCAFFNLPMQYPIYYGMYCNSKHNSSAVGWQDINHLIQKKDASSMIGTTVVEYSYKPQVAFLSKPWTYIYGGRCDATPDKINKLRTVSMDKQRFLTYTSRNMENGVHEASNIAMNSFDEYEYNLLFKDDKTRYTTPIEIGQYVCHTSKMRKIKVQPSLHVGVCPVPQLTTTNSSLVPDKFTDVECTWDIDVEMVCEFGMPYSYTHFPNPHIEAEQAMMTIQNLTRENTFREDLSTYDNQYIEEIK
uniref:Putative structural protein n=1 Tax=Cecropis daurica parvoviridae sp. TaxID=2794470 RepID=A0A8E7L4W9_9VIRU|nr:MAG: putative structural protein [Cecropis daurica parvoviridae sp.]